MKELNETSNTWCQECFPDAGSYKLLPTIMPAAQVSSSGISKGGKVRRIYPPVLLPTGQRFAPQGFNSRHLQSLYSWTPTPPAESQPQLTRKSGAGNIRGGGGQGTSRLCAHEFDWSATGYQNSELGKSG